MQLFEEVSFGIYFWKIEDIKFPKYHSKIFFQMFQNMMIIIEIKEKLKKGKKLLELKMGSSIVWPKFQNSLWDSCFWDLN